MRRKEYREKEILTSIYAIQRIIMHYYEMYHSSENEKTCYATRIVWQQYAVEILDIVFYYSGLGIVQDARQKINKMLENDPPVEDVEEPILFELTALCNKLTECI